MDDYISRKAMLDAYEEEQKRPGPFRFETLIESVPAADVSPVVHGRWEVENVNMGYCDAIQRDYNMKKYRCSVCGYETGSQAEKFKCCPICTALMDGTEENQ